MVTHYRTTDERNGINYAIHVSNFDFGQRIERKVLNVVLNGIEYVNVNRYNFEIINDANEDKLKDCSIVNLQKCVLIDKSLLKPVMRKNGGFELKTKYVKDFKPIIDFLCGTNWQEKSSKNYELPTGLSLVINNDKTVSCVSNNSIGIMNNHSCEYDQQMVLFKTPAFEFANCEYEIWKKL